MGRLFNVEVSNRNNAMAAAMTLFLLLAGHTVLEVARDALFLTHLPVSELPFTYLGIAAAALGATRIDAWLLPRVDKSRLSMITLLLAALGTAVFYVIFGISSAWAPRIFYIWTGLVATFAVTQFWRLLADIFTVSDAKTLYPWIAAGGSLGAAAGAGLASLLMHFIEARALLLVAAGLLALTAFIPRICVHEGGTGTDARPKAKERELTSSEGLRSSRRYVGQLLALVLLAALSTTLVDYLFKAAVNDAVPAAELGSFFGRFYILLNVASLGTQMLLAPRLLRVLGANRSLVILPTFLLLTGAGGLVFGGLYGALLLKGADGTLRHSLHRSAMELLYLPLSRGARDRYKALIDVLGQRGGQALASLLILGVVSAELDQSLLAVLLLALSTGWIAVAIALRGRYLNLFRANLRAGSVEFQAEVPDLDLHSLESMMTSLNSERDEEVLATLELLSDYHRARLVPALLLYHPSKAVVLRTLRILVFGGRKDFASIARRLLQHEDDEVRATAMHALARILPSEKLRKELDQEHPPAVRASILVAIAARGLDGGAAAEEIGRCALNDGEPVRFALARSIRLEADPSLFDVVFSLHPRATPALRRELCLAFGALKNPRAIPVLIAWLGPRSSRALARDALVSLGRPALEAMGHALYDESLPRQVRGHLPRTLSRFETPRAANILFTHLQQEPDGWIRYKTLRGLRTLRERMPELTLDREILLALLLRNIKRAATMLQLRLALGKAPVDESGMSPAETLLRPALRDKETQALDRAIRFVALLHPGEDLRSILFALKRGDLRLRAEGRELLTSLVPLELSGPLEALYAEGEETNRSARLRQLLSLPAAPKDQAQVVQALLQDPSESVRGIAVSRARELGIEFEVSASRPGPRARSHGLSLDLLTQAIESLTRAPHAGTTIA